MMQFIVTGYDAKDEKALERRLAAREKHMALVQEMKEKGNDLYAAAILNEEGNMAGSVMIVQFESREELDKWLEIEPYIVEKVWEKIEVTPCKVPPIFLT